MPLTDGLVQHWLADGRVLCYRISNVTRVTVDATASSVRHTMIGWDPACPFRILFDLRCDDVIVSAYGLYRARELARLRPDLRGRVALVTTNILTAQIMAMAMRGLPNEWRSRRIFASEEDAVAWLLQDDKIQPSV